MDSYAVIFAFIFYLVQTFNVCDGFQAPGNLTLVQIIHRHGDRTPEKTFPNDPNLVKLLDLGFGELTNVGKGEQFELGMYLRNRYKDFASQRYKGRHVKCQSSDYDRTIMSAYCVLAGLYPPVGDQIWNANLTWQPIPVHMVPAPVDYMLVINKRCEVRRDITDAARIALNKKNKSFYHTLSNVTGMNVTDADDLRIIQEAVVFAANMNWTVPSWATRSVMKKMGKIALQGFNIMLPDKLSQKLASGSLLKDIVFNMENKTVFEELDGRQINIYSTHDTVLYGFLSLLDMYNGIKPPINSAIIIELYVDADYTYWIQVLYRNNSSEAPYVLVPLNCTTVPFCAWQEFLNLTSNIIPESIIDECKLGTLLADAGCQLAVSGLMFLSISAGVMALLLLCIFFLKLIINGNRKGYSRI